MIERITVRHFQSLTNLDITLQPLTVIVGPSSSGKSALIRALTTLIRNRRGTEFITHGERTASITAHVSNGIVTLTRSTSTAPNHYTLIPAQPLSQKQEFSKLGGETPAPVSLFLGIPTSQAPITIASQFDAPYLLSASPTEAARIFGSLTNASVLLDASRESNRRKLQAATLLRTRSQDLDQIRQRIPEFRTIASQASALTQADTLIARARSLATRLTALTTAADTYQIAHSAIPALTARLQALPDPSHLDALITRLQRAQTRSRTFQAHTTQVSLALRALQTARTLVTTTETAVTSATRSLVSAMAQIAQGFERAFLDSEYVRDGLIDTKHASEIAAAYVAELDS